MKLIMKKHKISVFGERLKAISIFFSLIGVLLLYRCGHERSPQVVSYEYIEKLNEDNIEYFKKVSPERYRNIPEYQVLMKIDAIVFDARTGKKIIDNNAELVEALINVQSDMFFEKDAIANLADKEEIEELDLLLYEYFRGVALKDHFNKNRFGLSAVKPLVMAESTHIAEGEEYYSEIYLGGVDELNPVMVLLNGDTLKRKGGVSFFTTTALKSGAVKKEGIMKVHNFDSTYLEIPFEFNYEVGDNKD